VRQSWDEYFFSLATAVSSRATCPRRQVGCVLVKNNIIVATGYNGSVHGEPHCIDIGCNMVDGHCVRTIHAEQNALLHATSNLLNAVAYVTLEPCSTCSRLMRQAGIGAVYFIETYEHAMQELNKELV